MKQPSESSIGSAKSRLGSLTKITTLGCLLALVCVVALSDQPKKTGQERPFEVAGIFTSIAADPASGTFMVVGAATHMGEVLFTGDYELVSATETGLVTLHIQGTYIAANGDTIEVDCPDWVTQYDADGNPVASSGRVNIIGGTGRFATASGSYAGVIFPGNPLLFVAKGTISY